MTELPPTWARTPLGELGFEVRDPVSPKSGESYQLWSVPSFANRRPEVVDGSQIGSTKLVVQPHDILICKINPRINRVWLVGEEVAGLQQIASPEWLILRVPASVVDSLGPYLLHYLSSPHFRDWISAATSGSTGSHTRAKSHAILEQLVPVPPQGEQQRIVATLEDHLSRIEAGNVYLSQVCQQESRLRTAIYTAAVEGRLAGSSMAEESVAEQFDGERHRRWREEYGDRKYKLPVEPNLEIGPSVPDSWHIVSLEAATDPVRIIRYGILMPRVKGGGAIPYVEVKDLIGETLAGKHLHQTSRELDEKFSKSRLAKGDVVMAVRGSYERSAVVPDDLEGANVSRDVVRIAPLPGLDPDYLHIYLQSAFSRRYFAHQARGVAVKGVNTASVRSLPIAIPTIEVQREIVREANRHISALNRISTEISDAKKRSDNLRRSLLAEAFAGRLVQQDPADEPASNLLKRICSELARRPPARRVIRTATFATQGTMP